MAYSKRTKQLAALLFMDRVARRLHKNIPSNQGRELSPEFEAWAIAFSALCQITKEL